MKLLLIRHAPAIPRDTPGIVDDQRPLTPRGKRRFREAARGLARIAGRPDVLLSSPLPRARATAEIAARAWGRLEPRIEPALAGEGVQALVTLLAHQAADATVALVGHEPSLSALLARLLGAAEGDRFALKKGGAALLELPGPLPDGGRLIWYLRPRILRTLGRD